MKKVIVLAGNFEQFQRYISNLSLEERYRIIYGSNMEKMMGVEADKIETIGTFWELPNASKIYEFAQTRIKPTPQRPIPPYRIATVNHGNI